MFYFAYGANMDRAVMRRHAPGAQAVGAAVFADHRFTITADGHGSVEPARGQAVHGVLWRLTARDRITLDLWEEVAAGHYHCRTAPVRHAGRLHPALIYVARRRSGAARPQAGYMALVIEAACAWDLPKPYIASLQRWLEPAGNPAGSAKHGKFEWM